MSRGKCKRIVSMVAVLAMMLTAMPLTAMAASNTIKMECGATFQGENLRKEAVSFYQKDNVKQSYVTVQQDTYVADGPVTFDLGGNGIFSLETYLFDDNLKLKESYYEDWGNWGARPTTFAYPGLYVLDIRPAGPSGGRIKVNLYISSNPNKENMVLKSGGMTIQAQYATNKAGDFHNLDIYAVGKTTIQLEKQGQTVGVIDEAAMKYVRKAIVSVNDTPESIAREEAQEEQAIQTSTARYYDGKNTITLPNIGKYHIILTDPTTNKSNVMTVTVHNNMPASGDLSQHWLRSIQVGNLATTKGTNTANTQNAVPTNARVLVDGKDISFDAYEIRGNNYFKLRDIAKVLSGTGKQFEVTWDNDKNAINMVSNKAYTVTGGEMTKGDGRSKTSTPNTSKIYLDGKEVSLTAYTINGNNYFKLRDLGQTFNFDVTWDGKANTIIIETSKAFTAK